MAADLNVPPPPGFVIQKPGAPPSPPVGGGSAAAVTTTPLPAPGSSTPPAAPSPPPPIDPSLPPPGFVIQGDGGGKPAQPTQSNAPDPSSIPGLDPDYYTRLQTIESPTGDVNPTSGAAGIYQWLPAAGWKPGQPWTPGPAAQEAGITNPNDQAQNEAGIRKFTALNYGRLATYLGRPPTSAELYLAHQQGAGGAFKLLNNPNGKAADTVGAAAVIDNGGTPDMTNGDFAQMVMNKYINANPNTMGGASTAAGIGNMIMAPFEAATGPNAVTQFGRNLLTGLGHAIDVPLNTISEGVDWLGQQFPNLGTIGGVPILPTQSNIAADQARIAAYNRDWGASPAASSLVGQGAYLAGSLLPMAFMPEANFLRFGAEMPGWAGIGVRAGSGALRGLLGGAEYGALQHSGSGRDLTSDIVNNALMGGGFGAAFPVASGLIQKAGEPVLSRLFPGLFRGAAEAGEAGAEGRVPMPGETPGAPPPPLPGAPPAGARGVGGPLEPRLFGPPSDVPMRPATPPVAPAPPLSPTGEPVLPPSVRTPAPPGVPPASEAPRPMAPAGVPATFPPVAETSAAPLAPLAEDSTNPSGTLLDHTSHPEALARAADFRALNIDAPTPGMYGRDPLQWQKEYNLSGETGKAAAPYRNAYLGVRNTLANTLKSLVAKVGGSMPATDYQVGDNAITHLQGKWEQMQKAVGVVYDRIKATVGDNLGMKPAKIVDALNEAHDDAGNDQIIESVRRQFVKKGLPDPFPWDKTIKPPEGARLKTVLSTSDAESLRKSIGNLDVKSPAQARARTLIMEALDEDVIDTAGRDVYGPARDLAHARFGEFDRNLLSRVQKGAAEPDNFLNTTVVKGHVADLQALKNALTTGTPEQVANGTRIWKQIQGQMVKRSIEMAGVDGAGDFKPAGFDKAINGSGMGPTKLAILHSPEDVAMLHRVNRLGHYAFEKPAMAHPNVSGSGIYAVSRGMDVMGRIGEAMQHGGEALGPLGDWMAGVPMLSKGVSAVGKVLGETAEHGAARRAAAMTPEELYGAHQKRVREAFIRNLIEGNLFRPR